MIREMPLRLLPLCITLAAAGLILQDAFLARMREFPDDTLLPPLLTYVHPAVWVILLAGFALSAAALILPALPRWSRATRPPCRHAGLPGCTASPDTDNSSASC